MKSKDHLSIYGIGPLYASISGGMTVVVCLLEHFRKLPYFAIPAVSVLLKIIGGICFLIAASLWLNALFVQRIAKHIVENKLVTTGAYAWVRNPIYSAIMFIMWAVLAWTGNLYLLLLFPVYPLLMTALLKATEEKWLAQQYGQEYLAYCKNVNRCIPWIPKRWK